MLRSVFRALLFPRIDAPRVQNAPYDVIPDAGEIFYAASANQDHRVLLQVMSFAGNVGGDFHAVCKPHPRHLSERRVRFLRRRREHLEAYAALKRRSRGNGLVVNVIKIRI